MTKAAEHDLTNILTTDVRWINSCQASGLHLLTHSSCYREHAGEHGGLLAKCFLNWGPVPNSGMEFTGPWTD